MLIATTFDGTHAWTVGVRVGLVDTLLVVGLGHVVHRYDRRRVLLAVYLLVLPAVAARHAGWRARARSRQRRT